MTFRDSLVALGIAAALLLPATPTSADSAAAPAQVSVCFTPPANCGADIVDRISAAKREIRVQAYGFTHRGILAALVAAKHRGVDVRVILDKSIHRASEGRSAYSGATYIANAGIPVWIDDSVAIAHNKVIVIDRHLTIGGSFNYTTAADTKNAENVTFMESATVAGWYLANWNARQGVSRRWP